MVAIAYVWACDRLEIRSEYHAGQYRASRNLHSHGRVFVGGAALAGEVLTMTANGWLQIGLFFAVLLAVTKPLGVFMARVFEGEKTFLDPVLRPIERLIYRLCGIDGKSRDGMEGIHRRDAAIQLRFDACALLD